MKVSGFTFIRNGVELGYPFLLSIQSILPLCDEFIIVVGESNDATLERIKSINSPKIQVITTCWNERMQIKGFTYGEQKMIGQYACTGDWAFYLEGDEIVHENDLEKIEASMRRYLHVDKVEALVFDYLHFYGNINTVIWSPQWYRHAPRIIKRSVRSFAPDGLFWTVLDNNNKKARYPVAAKTGARIYHYGWVRTKEQVQAKQQQIGKLWGDKAADSNQEFSYANIDPQTLRLFNASHPAGIVEYFPKAAGLLETNPNYQLSRRQKKHRLALKLEKWFNLELTKKHYTLYRDPIVI